MRHRRGRARAAWLLAVPSCGRAPGRAGGSDPAQRQSAGRIRGLAVLSGAARDQQRQGRVGHRPVRERHERPRSHLGRARRHHADRDVGQRPGHRPARLRRGGRRDALPRRRRHTPAPRRLCHWRSPRPGRTCAPPDRARSRPRPRAGATTISVQPGTPRSPLTFAAGDTVTVGSPAETDRIVSVSGARHHAEDAARRRPPGRGNRDEHAGRHHRRLRVPAARGLSDRHR